MKMTTVHHNAKTPGKKVITIEFSDVDFDRLPGLGVFLVTLQAAWEELMESRKNKHESEPFPGVICLQGGCAEVLTPGDVAFEETHCEFHRMDAWGVSEAECYCWQSSADNADVDVCGPHRQAWEARGEGPLPSSFRTR